MKFEVGVVGTSSVQVVAMTMSLQVPGGTVSMAAQGTMSSAEALGTIVSLASEDGTSFSAHAGATCSAVGPRLTKASVDPVPTRACRSSSLTAADVAASLLTAGGTR